MVLHPLVKFWIKLRRHVAMTDLVLEDEKLTEHFVPALIDVLVVARFGCCNSSGRQVDMSGSISNLDDGNDES